MTPVHIIIFINFVFLFIGTLAPSYPNFEMTGMKCYCKKTRIDLFEFAGSTYGVETRLLCLAICIVCTLGVPWSLYKRIERLSQENSYKLEKIVKLKEPKYHVVRQTITQRTGMEEVPVSGEIEPPSQQDE